MCFSLEWDATVDSVKMYKRLRKIGVPRTLALSEAWFNFKEWFSP